MKKIKSVKKNGISYKYSEGREAWFSQDFINGYYDIVLPDVVLNCPLFEIEYEPERWRAEEDKEYYYVSSDGTIQMGKEEFTRIDKLFYEFGNYFQTKEKAEEVLQTFKQVLNDFHKSKLESK